jgi:hypothetical protein
LASRILSVAKAIDDFIIDRILQPVINLAFWHLELPVHTIARVSVVLGAGIGLIWLHRFDPFPSTDFYQDLLCLGIMVIATYFQVRLYERLEPRRSGTMPAARLQGLLWRTAWLLDLAIFPNAIASWRSISSGPCWWCCPTGSSAAAACRRRWCAGSAG